MFEQVYFLGDVHGDYRGLCYYIDKYKIKNSLIIQVGDLGVGFHDYLNPKAEWKILEIDLNRKLLETNNQFWAIRGNHDNPKFWDGDNKLSNIELIPDYTVREVNDTKILFIGGGVSIDRHLRNSKTWWEKEPAVFDGEKLDAIEDVDVVVTHVSPTFAYPLPIQRKRRLHAIRNPAAEAAMDDSNAERLLIKDIYDRLKVKPKVWIYGHYHYNHKMSYDDTLFVCLGELCFDSLDTIGIHTINEDS